MKKTILICLMFLTLINFRAFAATENYYYGVGQNRYGTHIANSYNRFFFNNGSILNDYSGSAPQIVIKDSNQNLAIATLNEIRMTQDDDYYYFNVDVSYAAEDVTYDNTLNIGQIVQTINDGQLYVSNVPITNLSYEYKYSASYFMNDNYNSQPSSASGGSQEEITMTINDKTGYQRGYKNYSSANPAYTNTVDETNNPASFYSSLGFEFDKYLNGSPKFGHIYQTAVDYRILGCLDLCLLYRNGQPNYTMPKKPDYDVLSDVDIEKDFNKNYWNNRIKGKVKVKKDEIENYKYLNMYSNAAVPTDYRDYYYAGSHTYSTQGTNPCYSQWVNSGCSIKGRSVHSENAIDLSQHTYCDHNWVLENVANRSTHRVYCTKCEWSHEEDHTLEHNYDGISNNLCKCGYIDKVNYHFVLNDGVSETIDRTYDSYSAYTKFEAATKTGYVLDHYEKYEKQFEDMDNPVYSDNTPTKSVYIGNVTEMTDITGNFSTTYVACFRPIKYDVRFSNSNNKGLPIAYDFQEMKDCLYDTTYNIPYKDLTYGDYMLEGWSLTEGSDNVDATDSFINLTTTDNDIKTLYPVFDKKFYIFEFSNINNYALVLNGHIDRLKCYINTQYNLPDNIDVTGYHFKGWSLKIASKSEATIDLIPNASIYNYTKQYGSRFTLYPVYEPNSYKFIFSNENSKGLVLNGHIDDQVFYYNELQKLKTHIHYDGYGLRGWSLIATSSNIDFYPEQEIYNYTSEDNKTYTLYPLYDALKFNVVYSTVTGNFSNGLKVLSKDYSMDGALILEVPCVEPVTHYANNGQISYTENTKLSYYTDNENNVFTSINDIKRYIIKKNISNYILYLTAHLELEYTHPNSGGGGGTGEIASIKVDKPVPINDEEKKPATIYDPNKKDDDSEEDKSTLVIVNSSIPTEVKKIVEEKFDKEVAEYILNTPEALEEIEDEINEELTIQGMSMSPTDLFYRKYGVKIATTSYLSNYHLYKVIPATRTQKLFRYIGDHKFIFIIIMLIIIAGSAFYYRKVYKYIKKK